MAKLLVCDGDLIPAEVGRNPIPDVLACDEGWQIIDYVPPTDSTAIYAQLVALNEFDPIQIASLVACAFVIFTMSFSAAVVVRKMRQA